jgi:hypothetical protein
MMDYLCGKCHSVLTSGKVCRVCCFDNQPTVTIQGEAIMGFRDHEFEDAKCFVCKLLLTEGKCMTPTCPKNKDPYTLSREELLEKTTAMKNYDPLRPSGGKLSIREEQDAIKWAAMERFNDKAEEAADAFSGVFGTIKSDGGPSTYFDLCNGGTLNDELERKGDEQWLGDSFHLGNVVKLAWRWGIKEGTDKAYDANKLIYSGARLLMKYKGVAAVRKALQKLLDDPQFQEREKDE